MGTSKTLLIHHFPISAVTGVTVMAAEILRQFGARSGRSAEYLSFPPTIDGLLASLDDRHRDAARVIGFNLHIEVQWPFSLALLDWCTAQGVPVWVYVHDYWPQHRENLGVLVARGAALLASSAFLQQQLVADGFAAELVPVGVPLPSDHAAAAPAGKVFASAGRLAPRKRFADIARAYRQAGLDDDARLYLRLLPSRVFGDAEDAEQLRRVNAEISDGARQAGLVTLDQVASPDPFEYGPYFGYVCASAYEGFSMGPIEAAYRGCPPLMSDIPAHRAIAGALFGDRADEFLYPLGETEALAGLMRDEVESQRRRRYLATRQQAIRDEIRARWSLARTADALAALAPARAGTPPR